MLISMIVSNIFFVYNAITGEALVGVAHAPKAAVTIGGVVVVALSAVPVPQEDGRRAGKDRSPSKTIA